MKKHVIWALAVLFCFGLALNSFGQETGSPSGTAVEKMTFVVSVKELNASTPIPGALVTVFTPVSPDISDPERYGVGIPRSEYSIFGQGTTNVDGQSKFIVPKDRQILYVGSKRGYLQTAGGIVPRYSSGADWVCLMPINSPTERMLSGDRVNFTVTARAYDSVTSYRAGGSVRPLAGATITGRILRVADTFINRPESEAIFGHDSRLSYALEMTTNRYGKAVFSLPRNALVEFNGYRAGYAPGFSFAGDAKTISGPEEIYLDFVSLPTLRLPPIRPRVTEPIKMPPIR